MRIAYSMIILAQSGLVGFVVHVLIVAIILAAIIYIAQTVLPIPQKFINIVWLLFLVVVVIFALKFLAALFPG